MVVPRKRTVPVRMYRETKEKLRQHFPRVKMADLIDVVYESSGVKMGINFKNNYEDLNEKLEKIFGKKKKSR